MAILWKPTETASGRRMLDMLDGAWPPDWVTSLLFWVSGNFETSGRWHCYDYLRVSPEPNNRTIFPRGNYANGMNKFIRIENWELGIWLGYTGRNILYRIATKTDCEGREGHSYGMWNQLVPKALIEIANSLQMLSATWPTSPTSSHSHHQLLFPR